MYTQTGYSSVWLLWVFNKDTPYAFLQWWVSFAQYGLFSKSISNVAAKAILLKYKSRWGTDSAQNPTVVAQLSKSNNANQALHNLCTQLPSDLMSLPSTSAPGMPLPVPMHWLFPQPEGFLQPHPLWPIPYHLQVFSNITFSGKSIWPPYLNCKHTRNLPHSQKFLIPFPCFPFIFHNTHHFDIAFI